MAQDEITLDPSRRRSSFAPSWAIDDDECGTTTRGGDRRRKYSWGQVGEQGFMESCRSAASRSPVSHHECKFFYSLTICFLNQILNFKFDCTYFMSFNYLKYFKETLFFSHLEFLNHCTNEFHRIVYNILKVRILYIFFYYTKYLL